MENNELLQKIEMLEKKMANMEASRGLRGFMRRAFTKTSFIIGIVVAAALTGFLAWAAQVTFTDGTVISAADVNSNFNELYAAKWGVNSAKLYYNSGNVGVGTDDPSSTLHVAGDLRVDGALRAGVWQKVHESVITSPANHVVSGLDGNTDKMYMIVLNGTIVPVGGVDHVIGVLVNGATSDYQQGMQHLSEFSSGYNHLIGNWGTTQLLPLGRNAWNAPGSITMVGYVNAETGARRCIHSTWSFSRTTDTAGFNEGNGVNCWLDTGTNISSLVITFSGAAGFTGRLMVFAQR